MGSGSRELVALPSRVDVAIVGGGVAGCAVARLLAEAGADVAVLDAGTSGPSALGAGQLLCGVVEYPWRVVEALGVAGAQPLYTLFLHSVGLADRWDLAEGAGGLWVGVDAREAEEIARSAEILPRLGISAEVLDAAEADARTGLTGSCGALSLPDERWLEPARALAGLRAGARAAGAAVVLDTTVEAITDAPDHVEVATSRGRLSAEVVVYAGGVGLRRLVPFFEDKLVPVREQSLRLDASPAERGVESAWAPARSARAGFGYTWFRASEDELAVGGCRWASPHLEMGEEQAITIDRVQAKIEAFANRLAPGASTRDRVAWIEAHTCDGLPIVGPLPGSARHLACAGFCGNDYGLGLGAARALAEGLVGEAAATVEPRFAATRFDA